MKKLFLFYFLLFNFLINCQTFNYSGYVYNQNGQGLSNIPVNLYGKRTDPYDVTFPTYNTASAFNTGTVIPSSDDATHGPFNIGFSFTFFGANYTQFYVGSNGWIGFSSGQTTGYTAAYIPNAGSPKNVIMADWEDLLPGSSNIYYTTIGTSPNRKLVVSFNSVPHYSCNSNLHTFQFVLYETTNVIDINYLSKPLCNGNNSTAGLVNVDNTNVVPVGGKNASQWYVNNYSVRFTPSLAETSFTLKGSYLTNANGQYIINTSLDIQSFQFQIKIENISIPNLTPSNAQSLLNIIFGLNAITSKDYYICDVNNDSKISISDIYYIYSKMNNKFLSWPTGVPNYRIMTPTQWSTINTNNTDLRQSISGVQTITIDPPTNGGSSNFYLFRTGFKN